VSIAQEHLATGIAQLALARLYPHLPRGPALNKRALLACVEGELHDMGPRIAADFLEMAGLDVRFLGANVPATSLARMVRDERPDVVLLSLTLPVHLSGLRASFAAVREVDATIPVLAGGHAFRWDRQLAGDLPLTAVGVDAEELVEQALRAVGAR
jgi:methanogenic corrinoid protein MtbC1